jgi:hypothetical protein
VGQCDLLQGWNARVAMRRAGPYDLEMLPLSPAIKLWLVRVGYGIGAIVALVLIVVSFVYG